MSKNVKNVAVLGSTGSIGCSALEVIGASGGRLRAAALTAHSNAEKLIEQARIYQPDAIVLSDETARENHDWTGVPRNCRILTGPEGIEQVVTLPEIDVVLAAIVGSAGLRSTWAALEAGKTIALANKETLVVAGPLVMELAARKGCAILPVDSEHSAIFQALQAGKRDEVKRIVLTASGGPFRTFNKEQLSRVTVEDALAHPTWTMGKKITVDSATMMNKALEIIEARWLFGFPPEQIGVVIHPQSVVHSLVEYVDGSVVAQLSPPDMKLPIHYALHYPERTPSVAKPFDWSRGCRMDFEPPDVERFPALTLGWEAARTGGTSGAVLNAANEAAVARFLTGELDFSDIVPTCRRVLEQHNFDPTPSLEQLLQADAWARREVLRCLCT